MKKNTILHKIGQLIVPLTRTMSPLDADSHSACGGHFFNRSLLLLLLMLTLGINVAWGQTIIPEPDFSGTYYIASGNKDAYNYTTNSPSTNYYLCPTVDWYYYDKTSTPYYTNTHANPLSDDDMPFLTTYQYRATEDASEAIWYIEKHPTLDYYYIKHASDGKYLTYNAAILSNKGRVRFHLEKSPSNVDYALFAITYVPSKKSYDIISKYAEDNNIDPDKGNPRKYLNVNKGNKPYLYGTTDDVVDGFNAGGIIGLWTAGGSGNEENGRWVFEDAIDRPAVVIGSDEKITLSHSSNSAVIYYRTDGNKPDVSYYGDDKPTKQYDGNSFNIPANCEVIKVVAVVDGIVSSVETYTIGNGQLNLCQSTGCTAYYMVPGYINNNKIPANTTSVAGPKMEWRLKMAGNGIGMQYYYMINESTKDFLCWTDGNKVYVESSSDIAPNDDHFKFYPQKQTDDTYRICPKGTLTKYLLKDGGDISNKNVILSTTSASWNFIPSDVADKKTLFEATTFTPSNVNNLHYYFIHGVDDGHPDDYIVSPTSPSVNAATASDGTAENKSWVIVKAGENDWQTFYYIVSAVTGKYMHLKSDPGGTTNTETLDNAIEMTDLPDNLSDEAANYYQFVMARATADNAYYIIPKTHYDNFTSNQYYGLWNSDNRIKTILSRSNTANDVKWIFEENNTLFCASPISKLDNEGNVTLSCPTFGSEIRFTADGKNPDAEGATTNTYNNESWSASTQALIKAVARLKSNTTVVSQDGITILNNPDVTLSQAYTYNGEEQTPAISEIEVSITINNEKTTAASGTYEIDEYVNNTNVGSPSSENPPTVKLKDVAGDNWYIWNASTTFTITAAEITVSGITASNKVYDGNTTATLDCTNVNLTGKVVSEDVSITATGAFEDKNVGTGKTVNITGLTLGGSDASNYTLAASGQQATTTADITVKDITVSGITANNKTYDGTADAELVYTGVTLTGKVEDDNLTVTATGAFEDENVGNNKTVNISNLTLDGADAGNYVLAASGQQTEATADITAKEIIASGSITSSNKEYDGNTTATLDLANVTLTGKVDGDDIALTATGTFEDKNVGTGKTVNIGLALSGNDAGNYNLESSSIPTSITADITAKEVTASGTITANNKAYDGTTDAELVYTGVTLTGKVEGDDLTVTATGTFEDKTVGNNKTVTISELALDGTDKDNYQLVTTGLQTTTTADITVASITVSGITASNKIYDGNTTATLDFANVTLAGKVDNEDISVTATGTFADKNVDADKTVNITGLTLGGSDASNYALAESGQQTTATASVTAKEITVSGFTSEDKEYDGTTTATLVYTGVTLTGKVDGDNLTVTATGAFEDKNVDADKTVNISNPTLGGEDAGNYALAEFGQQTTATASITAKGITVSGITAADRVYDGTTTATLVYTSATLAGMVEDDDLSVTATGAFADKNVDTDKTVNISGLTLSGYDAGNYVLAESGQQTEATANITPKSVTVSGVTAENKVYDGTTVATLVLEDARFAEGDIIEGDELTLESGIGAFDTKDVGTNKTVNLIFGGADAGNYALAASGQQDPITADITPAPLTITANDKSISYGDAPANDGVTFGVDDGNDGTTNTFVDGEDENVLGGTLTFSYNSQSDGLGTAYTATDIVPMGTCYIIPGGWTSTNYFITFVPGTLTIGGKSIGDGTLAAGFTISFDEDNNIILQDGSRTLTEGTDYSIDGTSTISASGRYSTRTINGTGNYGGTANIRNAIVNFTNDGNGGTVYSATFVAESATPDASPDPQKGHALPDGITAYIITAVDGNTANAEALSYIPEGVPVLLLSNGDSNGFMVQDVSGQTAPTSTNLLKEVTEESKHFDVKTIYMLYRNEFVYNMAGDLSKGRVYLDPTPSSPSGARLVINWGEENGIDTSILSSLASPLPDTWHSLDGRRLNGKPTKKGLYIRNGQMVVIK